MRTPKIVDLAKSTLSAIEASQNASTDQSIRDALNEIKVVVDHLSSTDDEIIAAFKTAIDKVKHQGKLGLRGKKGSSFLKKAQGFLDEVKLLPEEKKPLPAPHSDQVENKVVVSHDLATGADCLPEVLHNLILEYSNDDKKSDQKAYASLSQYGTFFLKKVDALYNIRATEITHDLLRRIDVEDNLQILAKNSQYLMVEIKEVTSKRGQRIQDVTVLQALCMAGARNPRKLRADEKNYGLVERVYECFPDHRVADQQIAALHSQGFDAATKVTMRPVKQAIDAVFETIKDAKISFSANFQALLDLYVPGFKTALAPDPKYIVKSGFLFDISIFLYFFDQWEKHIQALGGGNSVKSDLVAAIIYPSLQECTDPGDLELFNTGMGKVLGSRAHAPLPSSKGMPEDLDNFFKGSFFGFYGDKYGRREVAPAAEVEEGGEARLRGLCRAKTSVALIAPAVTKTQCLIM